MDEQFNGYRNYETWCVALWLAVRKPTWEFWSTSAFETLEETIETVRETPDERNVEGMARSALARELREQVHSYQLLNEPGLYSDLLARALAVVDWEEIAWDVLQGLEVEPGNAENFGAWRPVFDPGYVMVAPLARRELTRAEILHGLVRHVRCEWGVADGLLKNSCLWRGQNGGQVISRHKTKSGREFQLTTETERLATYVTIRPERGPEAIAKEARSIIARSDSQPESGVVEMSAVEKF